MTADVGSHSLADEQRVAAARAAAAARATAMPGVTPRGIALEHDSGVRPPSPIAPRDDPAFIELNDGEFPLDYFDNLEYEVSIRECVSVWGGRARRVCVSVR